MTLNKKKIKNIQQELLNVLSNTVIDIADQRDFELYAVGGCVRDPLIGRPIGDIDIAVVGDAVSLAKEVAKELHAGKVSVYPRFGTALLRIADQNIEFATARRESYNPDSRKPAKVEPVSIEEDLKRRDFTINALALCLAGRRCGELIDLYDGAGDISRKNLLTPCDPTITFSDDPLRMLRAIRFAAELKFNIEKKTWQGLKDNVNRIRIVAQQRIGDEFWKMISGSDPVRAMQMLIDSGLMNIIIPEVTQMAGVEQIGRHHHKDVLTHSFRVMQNVVDQTEDPVIRFAALLHDIGKPRTKHFAQDVGWTFHGHEVVGAKMTLRIGRRLRMGKERLNRLVKLIRLHMRPINLTTEGVTDSAIRRLMVEAGDNLDDQLLLCRADITSANPNKVHLYLKEFDEMISRMGDVEARDKMRLFQSPIRGDEIMQICNIQPGPMVGALKEKIEDAILDGVIPYDYDAAKEYLIKVKDQVLSADLITLTKERRIRAQKRKSITDQFNFPPDESK